MPHFGFMAASVLLVITSCAWGADKQHFVDEQIRYLEHLRKAEVQLQAAEADAALSELQAALSCDVRDSYIPFLRINTKGAMAHYLRACAWAVKKQPHSAIGSLKAAAAQGFRNTALVKSDPRLVEVRKTKEFANVLQDFPGEDLSDPFAGKMVANRKFGMSLQQHRKGNFPKLGEIAPDFELDLLGEEQKKLRLSTFRGSKTVVLVFGSFT